MYTYIDLFIKAKYINMAPAAYQGKLLGKWILSHDVRYKDEYFSTDFS